MPTQHVHTIQTNIGEIEYLQSVRTNRPEGLKKPYEYVLPIKKFISHYEKLNTYLKQIESNDKLQTAGCWKKPVKYGTNLHVFILGYKPGLTGDDTGVTKEEWETVTVKVQESLTKMFGPDAELYIEPYSDNDKFQARFETYVMYKEQEKESKNASKRKNN